MKSSDRMLVVPSTFTGSTATFSLLKTLRQEELAKDMEVIQSRWNEIIFGGGNAADPKEEHGTLSQVLAQRF
ncbi:hypothetical protein M407DRAFT_32429 [Tulasnella calospora MUT 4182]|uniref:Uncharacterized protein n=1 Tax=Tulasnella calospora MUT 4182 TaxID=1051891 RepID=A0A0C3Q3Z9_9AGAM|nr:hypothetical protein M407DRAFT_32429 [Tulasnella calospora MUT 4182]